MGSITDVSDPTHPALLSTANIGRMAQGIATDGEMVYVTLSDPGMLQAWDFSDVAHPVERGSAQVDQAGDLRISGNLVTIVSNVPGRFWDERGYWVTVPESGKVQVVDVSDPDRPVALESYETGRTIDGLAAQGMLNFFTADSLYALSIRPAGVESADLAVTQLTTAPAVALGSTLEVGWTIRNLGRTAAEGTWTDAVYLSADASLDADDVFLGEVSHTGPLTTLATYSASLAPVIRDVAPGHYYLIAAADSGDDVNEWYVEANNVRVSSQPIYVGYPDLAVTNITVPEVVDRGDPLPVEWTVYNRDLAPAGGAWTDQVYLSRDTTLDAGDLLVGILPHDGGLSQRQVYHASLDIETSNLADAIYYVIVKTDAGAVVDENGREDNNYRVSSAFRLGVPALTLGQPLTDTFDFPRQYKYYRVSVDAGQHLFVSLNDLNDTGSNELYVKYGSAPTRSDYDAKYSANLAADQQVELPSTQAGAYYILAYAESAPDAPADFTLTASLLSFQLLGVSPNCGGNIGPVTLAIRGSGLPQTDIEASLVSPEGTVIKSLRTYRGSEAILWATFDLAGHTPGAYDLRIGEAGGPNVGISDVFQVNSGEGEKFSVTLTSPSAVRPGQTFCAYLEYSNLGDVDALPRLLTVQSPTGMLLSLDPGEVPLSQSLQLLSTSQCPLGVLRPGDVMRIPLYSVAPLDGVGVLRLSMTEPDDTPVDWESLASLSADSDMTVTESQAYWISMAARVGNTRAALFQALAEVAVKSGMPFAIYGDAYAQLGIEVDFAVTEGSGKITSAVGNVPLTSSQGTNRTPTTFIPVSSGTGSNPQTYFIVHGFITDSSGFREQAEQIASKLGGRVILVDWSWGSRRPVWDYSKSAADTEIVGREIVQYMKFNGIAGADTTIVGHSLGAQVAGFAGLYAWKDSQVGKLQAIYAEDPAGPGFEDQPSRDKRLDFSDADDVYVIHTTTRWGDENKIGHVDVYVDGYDRQGFFDSIDRHGDAVGLLTQSLGDPDMRTREGDKFGFGHAQSPRVQHYPPQDPEDPYPSGDPSQPPEQPAEPLQENQIPVVRSRDPNDKVGPAGAGEGRYTPACSLMPFTIYYENDPKLGATAPAQVVRIEDTLDTDLDLATFELGDFNLYGSYWVTVPDDLQHYQTLVDLRPEGNNLLVRLRAGLDSDTRQVTWLFESLDPDTMEPPDDAMVGFLPVNDENLHNGEGHLTYTIRPLASLATGTQITNQAFNYFDTNDAVPTPTTLNTIDAGRPTSTVQALVTQLPDEPFTVSWAGQDDANGSGVGSYTVYVSDNGGAWQVWQQNTTDTSAQFIGVGGHSYAFRSVARDNVGHVEDDPGIAEATTSVDFSQLRVDRLETTPSGFVAHFKRALDPSVLNLYDVQAGTFGQADVTVIGAATGPVTGSLLYDPAARTVSFMKTGGPLAPDTYTLTLRSAANAFKDSEGHLLDGDADNVEGGDYVNTVTVEAGTARMLSLRDFARGPGQAVNVPATGSGIPISIDNGAGILGMDFVLQYDPVLLTVTDVTLASGMPAGWSVERDLGTPGRVAVWVFGQTPLPAGAGDLVRVSAQVPNTAPYSSAGLIWLENLSINEGAIPSAADSAMQVVAYLGDATGNHAYSALDAAYLARVGVGLDGGFAAYRMKDPVLLGDTTGNGTLSSLDASYLARKGVGLPQPEIPNLPGVLPAIVEGGPDPLMSVPNLTVVPGGRVRVPVLLDDATGLQAADISLQYDTSLLDLTGADVSLGVLTAGWTLTANVDDAAGEVRLWVYSTNILAGGSGSLVELEFEVPADAQPGQTAIDLLDSSMLNEGRLVLTLQDGQVTVRPLTAVPYGLKDKALFYKDADGTDVTVTLKGGSGTFYFLGEATYILSKKGITVTGTGLELAEVSLTQSDNKTSLAFATKGGTVSGATLGRVTGATPLGKLAGATIDLVGGGVRMTGAGYVGALLVREVRGGADLVMPGTGATKGITIACDYMADVDVSVGSWLKDLSASEWIGGSLQAPRVGNLTTKGRKPNPKLSISRLDGNLQADLVLGGPAVSGVVLGSLNVLACLDRSNLSVTGQDARSGASVNSLKAGRVGNVGVTATGGIGAVAVGQWISGTITAGWLGSLATAANQKLGLTGNFGADLVLTGAGLPAKKPTLGSAKIAGNLLAGTEWDIRAGFAGALTVAGTVDHGLIRSAGDIVSLVMGASNRSDFGAGVDFNLLEANRHVNVGDVTNTPTGTIKTMTVTGWKVKTIQPIPRFFVNSNISAGVGRLNLLNWDGLGGLFAPSGGVKTIRHKDTADKSNNWVWPAPPRQISSGPDEFINII